MRVKSSIIIVLCLVFFGASLAHAGDIYISQCGTGTYGSGGSCATTAQGSGSSCTDAHSASWFNSNAAGGNTYHLCGTFIGAPGSTMLTPPSGSAGKVLNILFEKGASLQSPRWGSNGAIYLNAVSYITIDGSYNGTACGYIGPPGQGKEVACNGVIENTANGSPAAGTSGNSCSDGWSGYAYNASSEGIEVNNSSNIEIKNLAIRHIYMNDGASSCLTDAGGQGTVDIYIEGTLKNVNVDHCELADARMGIATSNSTIDGANFYNNYIHSHDWGIAPGATVSESGLNIYNNEITDWTAWGYPDTYHQDGIIINNYQTTPGPTGQPNIYNNYIHGALVGASPTAFIFCTTGSLAYNVAGKVTSGTFTAGETMKQGTTAQGIFEGYSSGGLEIGAVYQSPTTQVNTSTPWVGQTSGATFTPSGIPTPAGTADACAIFNNVLVETSANSGSFIWLNMNTGQHQIYNNTMVYSNGGGFGNGCVWDGTNIKVENNIFDHVTWSAFQAEQSKSLSQVLAVSDYNDIYLSNTLGPYGNSWFGTTTLQIPPYTPGAFLSQSQWQGLGYDKNSITSPSSLQSNFQPSSTSKLIKAGVNLSSLCVENGGALPNAFCSDAAGNPRPTGTTPWDIGAYQYAGTASGAAIPAPSNLRIKPSN